MASMWAGISLIWPDGMEEGWEIKGGGGEEEEEKYQGQAYATASHSWGEMCRGYVSIHEYTRRYGTNHAVCLRRPPRLVFPLLLFWTLISVSFSQNCNAWLIVFLPERISTAVRYLIINNRKSSSCRHNLCEMNRKYLADSARPALSTTRHECLVCILKSLPRCEGTNLII